MVFCMAVRAAVGAGRGVGWQGCSMWIGRRLGGNAGGLLAGWSGWVWETCGLCCGREEETWVVERET